MKRLVSHRLLVVMLTLSVALIGLTGKVTSGGASIWRKDSVTTPVQPLSPRLAALLRELQSGNRGALETFWQEVAKRCTPLVEPTPDTPHYLYVTFLWRGKKDTRNVIVNAFDENNQLADPGFLAQATMTLLPDSDVWYRTYRLRDDARFSYRISPNDALTLLSTLKPEEQSKRLGTLQADPFNPHHYQSRNGDSSVVELPHAPPQPWIEPLPGVPKGKVEEIKFKSTILNNERPVWVYTPPGYKTGGQPYHLLVTFDGITYVTKASEGGVSLPTTLNNLLARGKLSPMVAVMIGNAPGARIKELWYHEPFNNFLAKEIIFWVRRHYHVTSNPQQTVVAGLSLGGGAALFAGFRHSEIFGNVISQSGGYMYRQTPEEMSPLIRPGQPFNEEDFPDSEWLTRQIATKPTVWLRVYLEAGLLEDLHYQVELPRFAYPSLILATRHLRDVLQAKGYSTFYNEYNGPHETLNWRGTLADGLLALLGKEQRAAK